ncbi:hypothetical protein [Streptomyces sp. NPDC085479]|uniref:hypothetical protein n=1 Tax=Streptomyces sp. NPDC085479 TaxID=3365726 RepID=UPI0037CEDCB0
MGTFWEAAELNGDGGSTTHDRGYAERWSRRAAESSTRSDYSDHYAEKAAAREAAQREAEDYRRSLQWAQEGRKTRDEEHQFEVNDPKPVWPNPNDSDYHEREGEWIAWQARKEKHLARVEGEKLAARISRR